MAVRFCFSGHFPAMRILTLLFVFSAWHGHSDWTYGSIVRDDNDHPVFILQVAVGEQFYDVSVTWGTLYVDVYEDDPTFWGQEVLATQAAVAIRDRLILDHFEEPPNLYLHTPFAREFPEWAGGDCWLRTASVWYHPDGYWTHYVGGLLPKDHMHDNPAPNMGWVTYAESTAPIPEPTSLVPQITIQGS